MFEDAAQRLVRDQEKIRGRKPVVVSEKAKRQADFQRKQRAKMQAERERKRRSEDYQRQYLTSCERALKVKSLLGSSGSASGGSGQKYLLLQPTSIHGTGDKLSLPPSVLETLTTAQMMGNSSEGNPWTFRIGIPNAEYQFPASALIQTLKPPTEVNDSEHHDDDDDPMINSDDDDDEGDDRLPYLDEMAHKYLAYTHCTVVEFTQEEGHVGIPQHIASALLDPKNRLPEFASKSIPVTRTVDPSAKATMTMEDNTTMESTDTSTSAMEEDPSSATPGHVAYGAFPIPNVPLEISLVKLPKGKGCTLVPTKDAVQRGFYGLKDVKMVLEQSLIRTRATLSKGDVVSTWHRGVQYDLDVTKVLPSAFGAVTCINTDIEVDIGEVSTGNSNSSSSEQGGGGDQTSTSSSAGHKLGTGQTLGSAASSTTATTTEAQSASATVQSSSSPPVVLLPEPPADQTENVVNVQIRYSGGNSKRRFDITKATAHDLFDFAASLLSVDVSTFRLVTRFPRRVFAIDDSGAAATRTLIDAGIQPGQELFLVEMI
jgi:hypothetical protein